MDNTFTWEDVANHSDKEKGVGVIVDNYPIDLILFLQHHPAGAETIIQRREKSMDISLNFLDHFGHTVQAFWEVFQRHDRLKQRIALTFYETAEEDIVFITGKVVQMRSKGIRK